MVDRDGIRVSETACPERCSNSAGPGNSDARRQKIRKGDLDGKAIIAHRRNVQYIDGRRDA